MGGDYFDTAYLSTPGIKYLTVEALNNGVSLQKYSISFTIAKEYQTAPKTAGNDNNFITGLSFVNADTNTIIRDIEDGGVYSLLELSTYLNIKANVNDEVTDVKFWWGKTGFRHESVAPFAMGGEVGGEYFDLPFISMPGTKSISMEAFKDGESLMTFFISFDVVK